LNASTDIGLISPTYVFATPFLGGQAAISLAAIYGNSSADISGILSGIRITPAAIRHPSSIRGEATVLPIRQQRALIPDHWFVLC
jgi:hypothetical protein